MLGGLWGYLAAALATLAGVVSIFLTGRQSGRNAQASDTLRRIERASREAAKVAGKSPEEQAKRNDGRWR